MGPDPNQGVLLFDSDRQGTTEREARKLIKPSEPDASKAYQISQGYFDNWRRYAETFLSVGRSLDGKTDVSRNIAAFQLHQAAEAIYRMLLLTVTLYAPATHHLGKLRQKCEAIDPRLSEAWGPEQKPYKRYFELLRRAYVEARYSPAYETTPEILKWQAERIARLLEIADASCKERLARLQEEAKGLPAARRKG